MHISKLYDADKCGGGFPASRSESQRDEALRRVPAIVERATELMKPLMDRLGEIPAEHASACRDAMVQACVRISIQLEDEARRQLGIDS